MSRLLLEIESLMVGDIIFFDAPGPPKSLMRSKSDRLKGTIIHRENALTFIIETFDHQRYEATVFGDQIRKDS